MESQDNQNSAPLGVLLIATYWIFVGITFLATISSTGSRNLFSMIPTLIGIFFIILGWGLISLRTWAYYITLVLSIIGLIPALTIIPAIMISMLLISRSGSMYLSTLLPALYILPFIPMAWYLFKNGSFFVKKKHQIETRYCPNCGRSIPSDSRICPYCGKKLNELFDRKTEKLDPNWEEHLDEVLKKRDVTP